MPTERAGSDVTCAPDWRSPLRVNQRVDQPFVFKTQFPKRSPLGLGIEIRVIEYGPNIVKEDDLAVGPAKRVRKLRLRRRTAAAQCQPREK